MEPLDGGIFVIFIGAATVMFSVPILLTGFAPQIARFSSKVRSETMDHAGEDIKEATAKTANVIIPGVTPAIKEAYHEIKTDSVETIEEKLKKVESLYNRGIITKTEYEQMRKNILDIE